MRHEGASRQWTTHDLVPTLCWMLKSRREFILSGLTLTGASALAPMLSSCSSLDSYLMGEAADGQEKVVILGAGASGLSAAMALRKDQVPFRVYEGSDRLGGRAYTLSDFNRAAQHCELGAEWILPQHEAVLNLAKELRVSLLEKTTNEPLVGFGERGTENYKVMMSKLVYLVKRLHAEAFGGAAVRLTEENKLLYPRALVLHQINGEELVKRLGREISVEQVSFLRAYARWIWGAELAQVSGLSIANSILQPSVISSSRIYRFSGGSGVLMRAMFDRLSGVMPEQYVRFQHQLISVKRRTDGIDLVFSTPWGDRVIKTQMVICTLPLTCLRQVDGIDDLDMPAATAHWIRAQSYGEQTKIALSFQDQAWRKNVILSQSNKWLVKGQWLSVASSTGLGVATGRGILNTVFGGTESRDIGQHSIHDLFAKLSFLKADSWKYENIQAIKNWGQSKWSLGSMSLPMPGSYLVPLQAMQNESATWFLSGEHTSQFPGTLNGAIESGIRCAETVRRKIKSS